MRMIWALVVFSVSWNVPGGGAQSPVPSASETNSSQHSRDLWKMVSSADPLPALRNLTLNLVKRSETFPISSHLNVKMRLHKLEYYFNELKIPEEDCRQRLLCEIAMDETKFTPLSSAFMDETRFNGDEKTLSTKLLTSNEGTKLLTYIEASLRGINRQGCEIWTYRCPQPTESMINYESLLMWREMSKWLTVRMVAKRQ